MTLSSPVAADSPFNLADLLAEAAGRDGTRELIIGPVTTLSYAEADARATVVAAHLMELGLVPGTCVAVQLPSVPEFIEAFYGVLRAGMIAVPMNPQLKAGEIGYQLQNTDARVLITCDASFDEALQAAGDTTVSALYVVGSGTGAPARGGGPEVREFAQLQTPVAARDLPVVRGSDTAVIIHTSGTTGKPKGAELTHAGLAHNCRVGAEMFGIVADDVVMGVLPLFHVFGLSTALGMTVASGASIVLVPGFVADDALEMVDRYRVSVFLGVPTMYVGLLEAASRGGGFANDLRIAISGGGPLPREVIREFEARFPDAAVLEGYGLTETASIATINRSRTERRFGSVGRPIPGVEVRVVDRDGREMAPGEQHVGEFIIRGHNVMKGYLNNPGATDETVRDGWLHTGDLGYQDDNGYFYVVDRAKDLVIRGGYNVYPREVEELLHTHPAVLEAAVIGRPDRRLGEEVVAVVRVVDPEAVRAEDIIEFARARLAAYKRPREVRIISEFPKTGSGKILKSALRASFEAAP